MNYSYNKALPGGGKVTEVYVSNTYGPLEVKIRGIDKKGKSFSAYVIKVNKEKILIGYSFYVADLTNKALFTLDDIDKLFTRSF